MGHQWVIYSIFQATYNTQVKLYYIWLYGVEWSKILQVCVPQNTTLPQNTSLIYFSNKTQVRLTRGKQKSDLVDLEPTQTQSPNIVWEKLSSMPQPAENNTFWYFFRIMPVKSKSLKISWQTSIIYVDQYILFLCSTKLLLFRNDTE